MKYKIPNLIGVREQKTKILTAIDSKTKLLALIALIAEALFISSIPILDNNDTIYALIICSVILIITIIGIAYFEKKDKKQKKNDKLIDDPRRLEDIINQTLHTICRAVCIPNSPDKTKIRAFIFKKIKNELVCKYYWTLHPLKEIAGELRFKINRENEKNIVSINALKIRDICGTKVAPLSKEYREKNMTGELSNVKYVLAAPIYNNKDIWGTVNLDAIDNFGEKILSSEVAHAAVYQLTVLLQEIIQLDNSFN